MDSITQAALGAAIGGAHLGPRLGRGALALGAAVATVPDLDVLFIPLLDPLTQLTAHRTYTHNVFFLLGAGLLLAALLHAWRRDIGYRAWLAFCLLCLGTAVALDCFTAYGVRLLYPFSDVSVAIGSISVVDPLYTLPLLVAVGAALARPWWPRARRWLGAALLVSSAYLALGLGLKIHAHGVFARQLAAEGVAYQRLFTKATFFNIVLWRGVAETADGYRVAFYSLFDDGAQVVFRDYPKGHELLGELREAPVLRQLSRATDGYYQVLRDERGLQVRDMRYGSGTDWLPPAQDRPFVFTYRLRRQGQDWYADMLETVREPGQEWQSVRRLLARMAGEGG